MIVSPAFWIGFNAVVLVLLALDLLVLNRKPHAVTLREAAITSAVWIALSLGFNALIWHWDSAKGLEFLTGYLIEYSLSVDNIFVFVLIFGYFKVPAEYQHRVLFWGIIGALVMRGLMIWLGIALIERFDWMLYLFGAFLVFAGVKMLIGGDPDIDPEHNPLVRLCTRFMPVTRGYHGPQFTIVEGGRRMLTPLALVLVMVESTDLLFALDSIPAIIAITQDRFIVYTSNICAILGLRSLYFLLAHVVHKFVYLKHGLALILSFIGVKMLIHHWLEIPTVLSLGIVALCLVGSIAASLLAPPKDIPPPPPLP